MIKTKNNRGLNLRNTLKQLLSSKNLKYSDLAEMLEVSEATIKRSMSREEFTLDRLSKIADFLDIGLADLFQLAESEMPSQLSFTSDQEKFFVQNQKAFLCYHLLYTGLASADAARKSGLQASEFKKIQFLLQKHQLIELWPKDRIRVLHRGPIKMIPGGPLEREFKAKVAQSIYDHLSKSLNPKKLFRPFEMTLLKSSSEEFKLELLNLIEKYRSKALKEIRINPRNKLAHYSGLIAFDEHYPWAQVLER